MAECGALLRHYTSNRIEGSNPSASAIYGDRSSVGRAPDCGSGRRGFESHRSPQTCNNQDTIGNLWDCHWSTVRAVSSVGRAADS